MLILLELQVQKLGVDLFANATLSQLLRQLLRLFMLPLMSPSKDNTSKHLAPTALIAQIRTMSQQ